MSMKAASSVFDFSSSAVMYAYQYEKSKTTADEPFDAKW